MTEFVIADVIEHKIPREEFPENHFQRSFLRIISIRQFIEIIQQFCVIPHFTQSKAMRIELLKRACHLEVNRSVGHLPHLRLAQWGDVFLKKHSYFYAPTFREILQFLKKSLHDYFNNSSHK